MAQSVKGYNRLSSVYAWLEHLAFANTLMRARLSLLPELKSAKEILILGEGDGRFLRQAVSYLAEARFVVLEQSPNMIALAKQRFSSAELERIQFIECDIQTGKEQLKPGFDAIITCFFLDMFNATGICNILETFSPYLKDAGYWYYVDFAETGKGVNRLYQQAYLRLMYWFFAWQTGLETQKLVNPHSLFEALGFRLQGQNDLHFHFLSSRLYQKVN